MNVFKDVINFFKLDKKTQVSILFSCIIIILLSQFDSLLEIMAIKPIIVAILPITSVIAIVLFSSILGEPIYEISKDYYLGFNIKKNIEYSLKQLTSDEKKALIPYIEQNVRTQHFNIQDGVASGLSSKRILFRSSNIGGSGTFNFAYNIQDIAFNILTKHPEYLDTSSDCND